nr:metallophosphoesterase [Archaeoglobus neptunius]
MVLSDIHSSFSNLKNILDAASYDTVFIAGDITQFKREDVFQADAIISKFTDECYAVHGNCDYEDILEYDLDAIRFIHGKSVKVDNFTLHGLGGSGITPFGTPSEYTEEEMRSFIQSFQFGDRNILLSHCPPKGILDTTRSGINAGCRVIRENIGLFDVAFCGHIHECHGIINSVITAVNPGPVMWGRFAIFNAESMEAELNRI